MKRFSEQLHKKASKVKMSASERADVRDRLVSYMEYHPLPAQQKKRSARSLPENVIKAEPFVTYNLPFVSLFKYTGIIAVLFLVFVPFMAERAVPGDRLYAVKVKFNEEVRSTLTLDPYQKIEWETVRLNRRIAEAKLLADEGLLTPEAEAEAAAAVQQHVDNANAEIETLRVSDADEATMAEIALDSTLDVQAEALATKQSQQGGATSTASTNQIATVIDESREARQLRATTSLPALTKLVARVEQHTTRLRELESSLDDQVSAADLAEVTRRIDDIERMAATGLALESSDEMTARAQLVDVLSRIQKLIIFMTELDVRETVAIERVVPVVLTEQEKILIRREQLRTIDRSITRIEEYHITNDAILEKFNTLYDQLQADRKALNDITDHVAFMIASEAAVQLADDLVLMIEGNGTLSPIESGVGSTAGTSTATTTAGVSGDLLDIATTSNAVATSSDALTVTNTNEASTTPEMIDESQNTDSNQDSAQEALDANE